MNQVKKVLTAARRGCANSEVHIDMLEIQQDCEKEPTGQKISLEGFYE
jgi:hypothetical protein